MDSEELTPVGIRYGILDMQVCVPRDWTDAQVCAFAEKDYPSGTDGWTIRRPGDAERVQCQDRPKCVHIMLDA